MSSALGSSWNLNATVFEGLQELNAQEMLIKLIFLENRKCGEDPWHGVHNEDEKWMNKLQISETV
jgi:hypothetical protein